MNAHDRLNRIEDAAGAAKRQSGGYAMAVSPDEVLAVDRLSAQLDRAEYVSVARRF